MTDLCRLSARDAARRIAEGSLSAEGLARACLERIAQREAAVGAWEYLDPERALAEARARDEAPPGGRGALFGLPVGVKDIMDTADMPTAYGSAAYRGHRPAADAAAVALARGAGAVALGKTVTTEFASVSPGKTRNPHNLAHTPGGSSSGSAAAVADFMVPLAFGTQTAGSVIRPASFCGIVGFKPSFGTIAIAGTKPYSESLDTLGVLTREVGDAALLVAALSGRPELVPAAPHPKPRLGVFRPEHWERAAPATVTAIEHAVRRLAAAGAEIAERPAFPAHDGLTEAQLVIMRYEMARNFAWERMHRWQDLTAPTRAGLEEGAAVGHAEYARACEAAAEGRAALPRLFEGFDALLVPAATGEAPEGLGSTGDTIFNRAWTLLHVPCVTVPATRGPSGLPVGIQLVGRRGDDARLLAIAAFAEAALGPPA